MTVSPDGYSLDNFYLSRPGADDVQLDLFGDYKSNVALYPTFQEYFRARKPPFLAVWGKNDPFFLPPGAEAFKRDIPDAEGALLRHWPFRAGDPCRGNRGSHPRLPSPLSLQPSSPASYRARHAAHKDKVFPRFRGAPPQREAEVALTVRAKGGV